MEEEYEKWGYEIKEKKGKLENLRKLKLQGNIERSRAKWVNEEEKPTKYFLHLEKRNFTNKIIPKVQKKTNEIKKIVEQAEILQEVETFYKTLYTGTPQNIENRNTELFDFLKVHDVPKLDEILKESLEDQDQCRCMQICKWAKVFNTGITNSEWKFIYI